MVLGCCDKNKKICSSDAVFKPRADSAMNSGAWMNKGMKMVDVAILLLQGAMVSRSFSSIIVSSGSNKLSKLLSPMVDGRDSSSQIHCWIRAAMKRSHLFIIWWVSRLAGMMAGTIRHWGWVAKRVGCISILIPFEVREEMPVGVVGIYSGVF